eukprot:GFUD01029063.1.p1 GENE.GFUD01029063.1~~GFUD01029063.1.p1  ORF type:complete len:116 (+),score=17.03 GFUD01029063.1:378-725(+)
MRTSGRKCSHPANILSLPDQNEVLRTNILSRLNVDKSWLNLLHQKSNMELEQDLTIGPGRLWSLRSGFTILSSSWTLVGPAGLINLALEKLIKLCFETGNRSNNKGPVRQRIVAK